MIVERMTFVMKPGRSKEGMEIVQELRKLVDLQTTYRIYLSITGQFNVLTEEIEFEDFEQREKFWADLGSKPEFAQLLEKWSATVADSGGGREFLTLVE